MLVRVWVGAVRFASGARVWAGVLARARVDVHVVWAGVRHLLVGAHVGGRGANARGRVGALACGLATNACGRVWACGLCLCAWVRERVGTRRSTRDPRRPNSPPSSPRCRLVVAPSSPPWRPLSPPLSHPCHPLVTPLSPGGRPPCHPLSPPLSPPVSPPGCPPFLHRADLRDFEAN